MLSTSFIFAAINLQTASKAELMTIKGIGDVKANAIIKYRKSNKIKSADDLKNVKGISSKIIANIKGNKTVSKKKSAKKQEKSKTNDDTKAKVKKAKDSKMTKKEKKLAKKKKKDDAKAKKAKKKTTTK